MKKLKYLFLILAVLALASCDDGKDVKIDSTPIPTIEDYKTKSQPLNFRKSMLKQIEIGQLTKFEGRISQAIGRNEFRVDTKKLFTTYLEEDVYITFKDPPQVLEDDVVKFYARYDGTLSYKTGLGITREVPKFIGDYYLGPDGVGNITPAGPKDSKTKSKK